MCMNKVTWQAKSNSNTRSKDKWSKGYKVFDILGDNIMLPFYNLKGSQYSPKENLTLHTIYKNKSRSLIVYNSSTQYSAGFHIFPVAISPVLFTALHNMYNRNVFEVEYRKVSAIGEHKVHTKYPVDCVIAQEMRIIRCLSVTEIEEILKNEEKISRTDR